MNQKPPQTKIEINRGQKGAGGLAALLSKLGLGGGGSSTVTLSGAGASAAGGALSGGILATKAGVVALVLAGSTVAAGIGLIGTGGLSMPGSAPSEATLTSFPTAGQSQAAAGSASGASGSQPQAAQPSSLSYLQQANPSAPAQQAAVEAPAAPISAPDNSNAPAYTGSANVPRAQMAPAQSLAGRSGGSSSGGMSGGGLSRMASLGGGESALGGFQPINRTAGTTPQTSGVMSGRKAIIGSGGNAMAQAKATSGVVRGNLKSGSVSSQGSGLTYDGGTAVSGIGPTAGSIQGGGIGTGGQGMMNGVPAASTLSDPDPKIENAKINKPKTESKSDWQWAMWAAIGAMVLAVGLMVAASKMQLEPTTKTWLLGAAMVAAGVAAAMGVVLLAVYKQTIWGAMFAAIGAALAIYAGISWYDSLGGEKAAMHAGELTGEGQRAALEQMNAMSGKEVSTVDWVDKSYTATDGTTGHFSLDSSGHVTGISNSSPSPGTSGGWTGDTSGMGNERTETPFNKG